MFLIGCIFLCPGFLVFGPPSLQLATWPCDFPGFEGMVCMMGNVPPLERSCALCRTSEGSPSISYLLSLACNRCSPVFPVALVSSAASRSLRTPSAGGQLFFFQLR